ncbi:nitroreductase family deazaflavin-dependent oxidoreductase [Conexibacter woesei]|uniref:nitroreductase family deazaflavin-dependent oxidoreductase n=1 Tax=Conexibacter woesei TaxID=191495 RepID=UPI0003F938A9|nr:nitroreductase family deazaflavin-dependent oxidoreductase [Conexibacter woesei]
MNDFNTQIIEEFRANDGVVGGMFEGAPMILVTHTGARSGATRTTPLVHFDIDGDRYIVASAAGAPNHPAWFHNILAHPEVRLEVGTDTYEATATPVDPTDRDRLYPIVVERMPNFADYEAKTTRTIPIVRLTPKA